MSPTRSRIITVLLAAVVLVGGANLAALAATGGPLLLGKGNTATKTTKLKTTGNGPALSLKTKASAPPFKISSSTKVTKLNADLVDGLDSQALKTGAYLYELTAVGVTTNFVEFALTGLPAGRYQVAYDLTAVVADTAPTFVGCFLLTGSDPDYQGAAIAIGAFSGQWVISGSGYVDTRTDTYKFVCQRNNGTSITIPADSRFPATLTFLRLDDVASTSKTGTVSSGLRTNLR